MGLVSTRQFDPAGSRSHLTVGTFCRLQAVSGRQVYRHSDRASKGLRRLGRCSTRVAAEAGGSGGVAASGEEIGQEEPLQGLKEGRREAGQLVVLQVDKSGRSRGSAICRLSDRSPIDLFRPAVLWSKLGRFMPGELKGPYRLRRYSQSCGFCWRGFAFTKRLLRSFDCGGEIALAAMPETHGNGRCYIRHDPPY